MDNSLRKDLGWISTEVCRHLWSLVTERGEVRFGSPRLLIPYYSSSDAPRVSEQELRFVFTHVLESHLDGPYAYSVEAPTYASHCFTGKSNISGQFDLGLHRAEGGCWQRVCNVEFKAGQPPHVEQDFRKITKDWQEDPRRPTGHYFHILESANAGTVPALLEKFAKGFKEVVDNCSAAAPVLITLCILSSQDPSGQWACSFMMNGGVPSSAHDPALRLLDGASTELRNCGSLQEQKEHIRSVWEWDVIE